MTVVSREKLTGRWEPLMEKPRDNQWRYFDPTGDSL